MQLSNFLNIRYVLATTYVKLCGLKLSNFLKGIYVPGYNFHEALGHDLVVKGIKCI